jgi:hypothetical protein
MPRRYEMYARLEYLHLEGFYIFALSYLQPEKRGWIDYSPSKIYSSKDAQVEVFEKVSKREYDKCLKFFHNIVDKSS